ncbi:FkbM family methyltransferase [Alloyangia pacifica]|uniref:Methyltransferase, FkbM family n=1 Tax=Alloyangia pacifica TaxID=311180 RepID=A0A1I6U3C2_9RHOB|nr:FkbM family methyltransferase [Alloyangia pacifica]SDH36732.1 methyltransferase, FkbM family [Alloyangia pacifica]SFS95966.1 methyltransferase, FkbM family [Alloyangia pacifica]
MQFDQRICVNEHGFYCVPEAYAAREIPKVLAQGGVYEPSTLNLMRRSARGGDIVSGGAFIGDFLPALSRALAPGARLHSFEPNPLSHAAAQETIALNALDNVDLAPVAVGAEPGELLLQVARPGGDTSAARARIVETADAGETLPVVVTSLDALVPAGREVSILHLDIEGHEQPALMGATRLIADNAPMIVLEAARAWRQRQYAQFLTEQFPKLGYRLCGTMERNAFYLPQR